MATQHPLAIALSVIPSLPRPLLSRLVTRAIEHLDDLDGDADLEDDSEDYGGDEGEPDFRRRRRHRRNESGPGCAIADPGEEDDYREDSHDAEIETWSHPDDHPAELFIGKRWQS